MVIVANNVRTTGTSNTLFLFARNVEGNVTTAFGQRETVIFGTVAGIVAGFILLLGGLIRGIRKRS
jgi:hypothetical protein